MLIGFGFFLESRWAEVLRIEAANLKLEERIAVKWRKAVARREAAAQAALARRERFQLRELAAIFIDARVDGRSHSPEEMILQTEKISRLQVAELEEMIAELHASSFPDDARAGIEAMLATALVTRCTEEPGHDELIHRFLMESLTVPAPEIVRALVAQITDPNLRSEVLLRLESSASP